MSGPVALIVNPVATKASRALREQVARALAPHGLEWSLVTEAPGITTMCACASSRASSSDSHGGVSGSSPPATTSTGTRTPPRRPRRSTVRHAA